MQNEIKQKFAEIVGKENVKDDDETLRHYSEDMTEIDPVMPSGVIFCQNTEQIVKAVKIANEYKIPITPRVAGTNLGGLTIPAEGGVVLDLTKMNRILEVNTDEMYAVIEPGVTFEQIKKHLDQKYDLVIGYPLSPPWVSIVANCLCDGLSNLSFRHGSMAEWINSIEVVLPTGEVMVAGAGALSHIWFSRAPMPDLVGLFVSWQGTTGIVTKMAVQLWPKRPQRKRLFIMTYDWEGAFYLFRTFSRYNIFDDIGGLSWPSAKYLLKVKNPKERDPDEPLFFVYLDISGEDEEELAVKLKIVYRILSNAKNKGIEMEKPVSVDDLLKINPDFSKFADFPTYLDFLIETEGGGLTWVGTYGPMSNLVEGAKKGEEIQRKYGFPPTMVFRAMKGGHFGVLRYIEIFDKKNPSSVNAVRQCNEELCDLAMKLGYIPYKSPIWMVKRFQDKINPTFMETLRKIKKLLDPNNIMNPGKWLL